MGSGSGGEVEGGDGELEGGPRGGGDEAGRPRAAAVRISAASMPAGDDGEVGRRRSGEMTAKWGNGARLYIWGRSGGGRETARGLSQT